MLTPKIIDNAQIPPKGKTRKLTDGGGLHLLLKGSGGRYWRLKYRLFGEEQTYSIGTYPEIGVEEARAAARNARKLIDKGVNPTTVKREAQTAAYVATVTTFGKVGREFIDFKSGDLAPPTARKLEWQFGCLASVHDRPISEVTASEVVKVLHAIEAKDHREAAHRVGQFAHRVFEFARARDYCKTNPIPSRRDILKKRVITPMAAITDPAEFGSMMRWIDNGMGRFANVRHGLQLIARTALRPGELRQALWSEIDLDKAEWRIPASRMKMRREHLVPLSRQAVEILKRHKEVSGAGPLVFPGVRSGRPMSDAAMNKALVDSLIMPEVHTVHGFRSSFSTIMNERGHDAALIELQLSHRKRDKIASIYDRSERVPERRKLMQTWSDLIDELKAETSDATAV